MASPSSNTTLPLLLVGDVGGITVVDPSTPLRRLNYFDGKFLRADDFKVEQDYLRTLVALSNQGLGAGVVYGYDTTLGSGDTLQVGPGLAIDPGGRTLLLQATVTQGIEALIAASRRTARKVPDVSGKTGGFSDCVQVAAPSSTTVVSQTSDLYVIAICSAEALCGQEDVYGIACQDACVSSSDRPYRLEGVVLRAIPLQLVTPFPTSKAVAITSDLYLRSKVAHSWYGDEVLKHPDSISRAGLLSEVWCVGAGYDAGCCEVPLAVVARSGASTIFLDAWTIRRERIDAPARRYWQWQMRMRPWDVFLAQVLQFQCQLADLLSGIVVPGGRGGDPCAASHLALGDASRFVAQVKSGLADYRKLAIGTANAQTPPLMALSLTHISDLQQRLEQVLATAVTPAQPRDRVLIRGGIVELPPAGYLPVVSGGSISVNDQVRALLGEGLDLRFCITTADYIAHAVEEAQHMDRISLLQGLDDPDHKPRVDVLVPDGQAAAAGASNAAGVFDAGLRFSAQQTGAAVYKGAARELTPDSGGTALYLGAAGLSQSVIRKMQTVARALVDPQARTRPTGVSGNLDTSAWIAKTGPLGVKADALVSTNALLAQRYVGAYLAGTTVAGTKASTNSETVDGLWLNAQVAQEIATLGLGGQTAVDLRLVIGTRPATPIAIDLSFHGTLTVAGLASSDPADPAVTQVANGTLNGVLAIGVIEESQAKQRTVEYLMTERYHWPVKISWSGDDASGAIALELGLDEQTGSVLHLTRRWLGAVQVAYRVGLSSAAGGATAMPLAAIDLLADADVVNASNLNHRYAVAGLDLVQAALVVSEPTIEANAEALLFPPAQASEGEITIQAVRDWVMFTRRREKQCQPVATPAAPVPPRSYRVIQLDSDSAEDAKAQAVHLRQLVADPVKLSLWIKVQLTEQARQQKPSLVLKFAGGSATATSDLDAAAADWVSFFHPGSQIAYAAAGAVDEVLPELQIARIKTFEGAISGTSQETAGALEDAIVPYPADAAPPDADGILLLLTLRPQVPQQVYLANSDRYPNLLKFAESPNISAAQWNAALAQCVNLGADQYAVDASGNVTVDDAAVKAAFAPHAQNPIRRAMVIVAAAGSTNDETAATTVVSDLGGSATPLATYVNAGAGAAVGTPSLLVVQAG